VPAETAGIPGPIGRRCWEPRSVENQIASVPFLPEQGIPLQPVETPSRRTWRREAEIIAPGRRAGAVTIANNMLDAAPDIISRWQHDYMARLQTAEVHACPACASV